jgi:hypothetical protein
MQNNQIFQAQLLCPIELLQEWHQFYVCSFYARRSPDPSSVSRCLCVIWCKPHISDQSKNFT